MKLALTLAQRLLLLLFTFIICYAITSMCVHVLGKVLGSNLSALMRISALTQDVIAFTVPAIATAMIVTRRPADLLSLRTRPRAVFLLLTAAIMFVSMPMLENIIYWNYNLSLPEWAAAYESWARQMEKTAFETMSAIADKGSIGSLIVSILIVGVAAGFSEELLFRGCFQRLLTTGGVNPHVAIWTVAAVFSALHFQFFGFVPRMLLGAYFGYLLLWTRSVWVPMAAHILNNSVYVLIAWLQLRKGEAITDEPTQWGLVPALLSTVATAGALFMVWKLGRRYAAADTAGQQ